MLTAKLLCTIVRTAEQSHTQPELLVYYTSNIIINNYFCVFLFLIIRKMLKLAKKTKQAVTIWAHRREQKNACGVWCSLTFHTYSFLLLIFIHFFVASEQQQQMQQTATVSLRSCAKQNKKYKKKTKQKLCINVGCKHSNKFVHVGWTARQCDSVALQQSQPSRHRIHE